MDYFDLKRFRRCLAPAWRQRGARGQQVCWCITSDLLYLTCSMITVLLPDGSIISRTKGLGLEVSTIVSG